MFDAVFQSFAQTGDPSQGKARAAALRRQLRAQGFDGFIVPRSDEHQSEYTPPSAERLAWLTGFSGSAGVAIVLPRRAAIFIDGRYTLQVREEVDAGVFEPVAIADASPADWLARHARRGAVIGYDPWLTTPDSFNAYARAAARAGAELRPVTTNPVDAIWTDRPAPPKAPVNLHPDRLAGAGAPAKLARLRAALDDPKAGADAMALTDPHDIAWLFNIRGSDVSHTPLALCFAIAPRRGKARIFIDPAKISPDVARALKPLATIEPPDRLEAALGELGRSGAAVLFDAQTAPVRLTRLLQEAGGEARVGTDPVRAMKAEKNAGELRGARQAHLRDGAAMVRFLAWFDAEAPKGKLTEIDAVKALETFRRQTRRLEDISFPTIAGAGPNGAIVHYRVNERSNRRIGKGLFLIDSGGQYRDGTTDITRTIAVGAPTREMRARFTLVLKGHIALASAVFPAGATGAQLDAFARRALWEAGLDYNHGTGHGVGSFLSVHEGPQNISKRPSVALRPGMILSNEPGYYKEGAYGIRIENLVVVTKLDLPGAEHESLCFETLTLAPIDRRLIEARLLGDEEIRWIDSYHAGVRQKLAPLVDASTGKWLAAATRRLQRG